MWLEGLETDTRRWVIAVALIHTFIPVAKHKMGKKRPPLRMRHVKLPWFVSDYKSDGVCFYPSAWHSRYFESGAWETDKTWKSRHEVLLVHACGKMLPWEMSPGFKPGWHQDRAPAAYTRKPEAMRGSLTHTLPRVLLLLSVQCHNTASNQMIWFLLGLEMRREGWRETDDVRMWCFAAQVWKEMQMVFSFLCWVMLVERAPTFLLLSHGLSNQDTHTHVDPNTFHTRAHYLVTYELWWI